MRKTHEIREEYDRRILVFPKIEPGLMELFSGDELKVFLH